MVAGDQVFTDREREDVERARPDRRGRHRPALLGLRRCARGRLARDGGGLLERLPEPSSAVLLAVDPGVRRVEVVTGSTARRWLDDRACGLAILTMTSSFGAGDLSAGIVNGRADPRRARAAPARRCTSTSPSPLRPPLPRRSGDRGRSSPSRAWQRSAALAMPSRPSASSRASGAAGLLVLEPRVRLLGDRRLPRPAPGTGR